MKRAPLISEAYPFFLREHVLLKPDILERHHEAEIVGTVHGRKLVRFPIRFSLSAAEPPTDEEKVDLVYPSTPTTADNATLGREATQALGKLATRARKGDARALWIFADIVRQAAEGLSQMASTNPEALRPIARTCARWPMMRSTHPKNCDNDALLEQMQIGEAVPVQMDKFSKWKPGHAATVAISLYEHLEHVRSEQPKFAKWLPVFSNDTREQWWQCARKFLLASYPHPETVDELARIVPANSSKRKSPGRWRQEILDRIKEKFLAMAK